MTIKEKVEVKEKVIRQQLETIRNTLNAKRLIFNDTPNDWSYITSLTYTETKLNEILNYFNSEP